VSARLEVGRGIVKVGRELKRITSKLNSGGRLQIKLRETIREAIKCGPVPEMRPIQDMIDDPQTDGEMVISFAADYLIVPEGPKIGKPLILEDFQCAFVLSVFDNPAGTSTAYYSVAKRNGKTFVIVVILLAFLVGPMRKKNVLMASGAMSRDQAALAYTMMEKILEISPEMEGLYHTVPSSKKIVGLKSGSEYQALSSEARTGHGRAYKIILLDEAGQISGASNSFTDMLETSQGTYEDAIMFTVSTQAPSDADYLSIMLDDAEASDDPHTVSHVYAATDECDLMDEDEWRRSNPGLGIFRSNSDLKKLMSKSVRIPTLEPGRRNLNLNQRVALESLYMAPGIWKKNAGLPDLDVLKSKPVCLGLDLSMMHDLTAAVIAAADEDNIAHVLPFVFCPTEGIEDRANRDKVPYDVWAKGGQLIPIGGKAMDYQQIVAYLKKTFDEMGITIGSIFYDRWRIDLLKNEAEKEDAWQDAEWVPFGQGYRDQSPSLENLQTITVEERLRHGSHPLLNMAARNAIAVQDPSGNIKIDKAKSTQRIDPLIALHQAVFGATVGKPTSLDTSSIYTRPERAEGMLVL
jgi:phage terminase large subunit-like protein